MPATRPTEHLKAAHAAIDFAQSVRKVHRRTSRRGSLQRESDIQNALDRLKTAMRPLRSYIGSFPYGPQTEAAEANRQDIRDASNAIQSSRRKLWKMQKRATL